MNSLKNLFFLPLRFFLSHDRLEKMHLKSLREERIEFVLKYCRGKLLDVGCGEGNRLVKRYNQDGVGVDVYPWDGVDKVCDTKNLPFANNSFDTVTLLATLNHIPEREKVLQECYRVLKIDGQIIITMINPLISFFRHRLSWWDKDLHQRGMQKNEVLGFWSKDVIKLLEAASFSFLTHRRFLYGLNNLYIGIKR